MECASEPRESRELGCGEFFSGIGAMHLALGQVFAHCETKAVVRVAFDINEIANGVYTANFGIKPVTRLIEHMPRSYYEKLGLDAWLMSPPCQPFTRGGNRLDHLDERSKGLLYLIGVLREMENPPEYIFLENVLNFEVSECHRLLLEALAARGYGWEEYLVSPMDPHIGFPNDRLRYYLVARRGSAVQKQDIVRSLSDIYGEPPITAPRPIRDYLVPGADQDASLMVKAKYITEYKNYRHDVVHPCKTRSTTFTKAYGSDYIIGTGSFLQTRRLDLTEYAKDDPEVLSTLGLRFFDPKEVARLHAFPETFEFPDSVSRTQRYRLLGNSMNVKVVAVLLRRLFFEL